MSSHGTLHVCPACAGRVIPLGVLCKAHIPIALIRWLSPGNRKGKHVGTRRCPHCRRPMSELRLQVGETALPLDMCDRCQSVWFDRGEFQTLLRTRPELKTKPRSAPETVLVPSRGIFPSAPTYNTFPVEPQDGILDWVLGILGMPVELNQAPLHKLPWVTWTLAVLCTAISLAFHREILDVAEQWGFLPAQPLRHAGMTLFSSFLLHGGPMHVISNVYFLVVFGGNTEDRFGRLRFALLLIVAHLASLLSHGLLDPRRDMPLIGASGAISGIIVFYALVFPRAKVGLLYGVGPILLGFLSVRAIWWVAF